MSEQNLKAEHHQSEAKRQAKHAWERLIAVDRQLEEPEPDTEYILFLLADAQSSLSRARSYCETLGEDSTGEEATP